MCVVTQQQVVGILIEPVRLDPRLMIHAFARRAQFTHENLVTQ